MLPDYTLNNPDTLTKYRSAAAISEKVLEAVTALCLAGEKIVTICEKGDKLLEEEIAKVYRGKKVTKGAARHPCCRAVRAFHQLTVYVCRNLPPHDRLAVCLRHSVHAAHLGRR